MRWKISRAFAFLLFEIVIFHSPVWVELSYAEQGEPAVKVPVAPERSKPGPAPRNTSYYDACVHEAEEAYKERNWGWALHYYREARSSDSQNPHDAEIILRIAECSEKALDALSTVIPAELNAESTYGSKILDWLDEEYGFYIEESEGDAIWQYDKRALQEFLKKHPDHAKADAVAYVLVKWDLMHNDPMAFMGPRLRAIAIVRSAITRYQQILKRYPKTNLRARIESDIEAFRSYVRGSGDIPKGWHYPGKYDIDIFE